MSFSSNALKLALSAIVFAAGSAALPDRAQAGSDPYLGDVMIVGFNFCPGGWAEAAGQLLPLGQNQTLFSLLGTQYGGDGRTTFALPDLRGRLTVGVGTAPGRPARGQGQVGGSETQTMTVATMPTHNHPVYATTADGDAPGPGDKLLAAAPTGGTGNETIYSDEPANRTMSPAMISPTGQGQPFPILDPFQALTHCIAIRGVYPPRS